MSNAIVEKPEYAETQEQMRAAISKLSRENALVHKCMTAADFCGLSGEDRYTLLAYQALTALAETKTAFMDHINREIPHMVVRNKGEGND